MLSVCIPVYNSNPTKLIDELIYQKKVFDELVEIVVIDDRSEQKFRELNKKTISTKVDKYVELPKNIGRASIRNRFLEYVTKPNLLFIDCDAEISNTFFLHNYIDIIKGSEDTVIVGGGCTIKNKPPLSRRLRWKYAKEAESKPAKVRNTEPYKSFITKNVIIPAKVLKNILFDERLKGYGHEDSLMGFRLKQYNIKILHIDNCVINADIETNREFLQKSYQAIESLFTVLRILDGDKSFVKDIKLLNTLVTLKKHQVLYITFLILMMLVPLIKIVLISGVSSVFLLNIYKLYYAIKICRRTESCKYITFTEKSKKNI